MEISNLFYTNRLRKSTIDRNGILEEFYSDKSRILFSSSFRRLMQKAQVFSLETNPSVRNRLTHSLEVADIGRTLARNVAQKLQKTGKIQKIDQEVFQIIVENACLIHDIGNPPFGHFGEEAIKLWFKNKGEEILKRSLPEYCQSGTDFSDFINFDGNPQGLRIVLRLHTETDKHSLNLTYSSILASIKYPNFLAIPEKIFDKKIGIFDTEKDLYEQICKDTLRKTNTRYFLVYLVELADDICYCLSDIADGFEKGIINSRNFKDDFKTICKTNGLDQGKIIPHTKIKNFSREIAVTFSRNIIEEASEYFSDNFDLYLSGEEKDELSKKLEYGKFLDCFKTYAKKHIYVDREAQRIEIAGYKIVTGLIDHFSILLEMSREQFNHFVENDELIKKSGLDFHWRVFKQLSKRMIQAYKYSTTNNTSDIDEWKLRAHLIIDYISGMTDATARNIYQNAHGINL